MIVRELGQRGVGHRRGEQLDERGQASAARRRIRAALLGASVLGAAWGSTALAQSAPVAPPVLPTGGTVVAGEASIATTGSVLDIAQSSQRAVIDWAGFSIGEGGAVHIANGSGATLNRVTGADVSRIDGLLTGTGSVYLVNANGIVIGKSGVVQTGGTFVAATLDIANADFMAGGDLTLSGASRATVVNLGKVGSLGGNVSLVGLTVTNSGEMTAPDGTAGLLAGSTVLLRDRADAAGSVFTVQYGAAESSAANGGLIQAANVELRAQQGNVYALAGNTAGVIRATGIADKGGQVWLVSEAGATHVAGAIEAQGRGGGAGHIETSGKVMDIGTASINAHGGEWLVDPSDLTIDATAAGTINASLATNNVTQTSADAGIVVNAALAWSSSHTLTLNAAQDIAINANIDAGPSGKLVLLYGQAGDSTSASTYRVAVGAKINLAAGPNFQTQHGTDGALTTWTVITDLGSEGSATAQSFDGTLQGINATGALGGHYVLGADIDASVTSGWNDDGSGHHLGFTPIGTDGAGNTLSNGQDNGFFGSFDGLGHTISGLTVDRPTSNLVGVFGASYGAIRQLGITSVSVVGQGKVGGLTGSNYGTLERSYVSGAVTGGSSNPNFVNPLGGLVGANYGTIAESWSTAAVSNIGQNTGGLVGRNYGGTVRSSFATGSVSGRADVGGLIGHNQDTGTVTDSWSSGRVTGTSRVGGFIGSITRSLTQSGNVWDTDTSGQSGTAGTAAGKSTALLNDAATFGLSSTIWATGAGLYPYLKSMFPNGVQAISGTVTDSGNAALGGARLAVDVNGALFANVSTGANGYYYAFAPAGTFADSPATVVTYGLTLANGSALTGASFAATGAVPASGLLAQNDVVQDGLRIATAATSTASIDLSALALERMRSMPRGTTMWAAWSVWCSATARLIPVLHPEASPVPIPWAASSANRPCRSARPNSLRR